MESPGTPEGTTVTRERTEPKLKSLETLSGYTITATDGDIGKVHDFLFDDESWGVRYIVVDTGRWLPGKLVLIAPQAVSLPDDKAKTLPIRLTMEQIRNSPGQEKDMPVSRRYQRELNAYYGWSPYWTFGGFYNAAPPLQPSEPPSEILEEGEEPEEEGADPHLRSMGEITGYIVQANDGETGHAGDFIVDLEGWIIRYMEVDTRKWLPGKRKLFPVQWIVEISWSEYRVYVDSTTDIIKGSPSHDPSVPLTRVQEDALYRYYGQQGYWR
ncbi:MAG: PRC-barrel domain-containing protein [Alphaproteobacteria bacterium]|uniref:PRC-barrel domain-containing protein n=1 Tax=Candidatus Nitrobium versatile TaxID=2884831 RepID=A0A953M1T9_9BACT|nr:PRC-barrel domain-containing protein [Candidatus Nitrobium versatile]